MIDHIIFTVSDLSRSKAFYEQALAPLGMKATPEFPWGPTKARGVGFGGEDKEFFIVEGPPIKPPFHIAFRAATRAEVKAFYAAALRLAGATMARRVKRRTSCRLFRGLRLRSGWSQHRSGLSRAGIARTPRMVSPFSAFLGVIGVARSLLWFRLYLIAPRCSTAKHSSRVAIPAHRPSKYECGSHLIPFTPFRLFESQTAFAIFFLRG